MMHPDKRQTIILAVALAVIAGGVLAWRFNLVPEIGKFFAAEPEATSTPEPVTACGAWEGDLLPQEGASVSASALSVSQCMDHAILSSGCAGAQASHTEAGSALVFTSQTLDGRCTTTVANSDGTGSICHWTPEQLSFVRDAIADIHDPNAVAFPIFVLTNEIAATSDLDCTSESGVGCPECVPFPPVDSPVPSSSVCPIPECANPPEGCSYQRGDRCSCGSLVCASSSPESVKGDVTGDGHVDIFDYNLVVSNFGKTSSKGDATGDGKVDIFDYNAVVSNFGK